VVLVVWAAVSVQLGMWATFAPRSFYDDYPGFGREWVRVNGPYNETQTAQWGRITLRQDLTVFVPSWSGQHDMKFGGVVERELPIVHGFSATLPVVFEPPNGSKTTPPSGHPALIIGSISSGG